MSKKLRMVIPKGRINKKIVDLLEEAGINFQLDERAYRPVTNDPSLEIKIMKPQNIPELLQLGSHDIGFSGFDWVTETGSAVTELMDLNFDPVRIVAAIPEGVNPDDFKKRQIVVASEYERLSRDYLDRMGYDFILVRTYGATEVFPPDDADMIIDNTSTGRTLQEHKLQIIDTVLQSSTRVIANPQALQDSWKKDKIASILMLFKAIIDARGRVMLEMNVGENKLNDIIDVLPSMRSPTVARLYGDQGHSVKVVVSKLQAAELIPQLKAMGATDILEFDFRKVVI